MRLLAFCVRKKFSQTIRGIYRCFEYEGALITQESEYKVNLASKIAKKYLKSVKRNMSTLENMKEYLTGGIKKGC